MNNRSLDPLFILFVTLAIYTVGGLLLVWRMAT